MCYEFERLEWLQRAEEYRRQLERAEEERKQRLETETPAKPATPDRGRHEPVPA